MRTSTAAMPRVGAQATPATVTSPAGEPGAAPWHVDAGLGLDGCLLGPSSRHPVGVEVLEAGELDLLEPLGGRHVPVETGDDETGREPVLDGQRLAVHPDRHHRRAPVEGLLGGEAHGEAVDGPADDLRSARLHPGPFEERREGHAAPHGVADQVAPHLVGDAADRDRLLDQVGPEEVVVAEGDGPVDHALDVEPPRRCVDPGDEEGGVDPVEVRVRRRRRATDRRPRTAARQGAVPRSWRVGASRQPLRGSRSGAIAGPGSRPRRPPQRGWRRRRRRGSCADRLE